MAFVKDHIEDCLRFLDKPYEKVHKWLDNYANAFPVSIFNDYHRTFRHNTYGLEFLHAMWGPNAKEAGRIHLIRDYLEGPITKGKIEHYTGENYRKMMQWYDNPMNMELVLHNTIIEGWIKEGFNLVTLSKKGYFK